MRRPANQNDSVLHLAPLPSFHGTQGARVDVIPYRGAPQTVGVLARAVRDSQDHMSCRQLAEAWNQGTASKDYVSEYLANYYGTLGSTRYMRDPRTVELVKAPYVIANQILWGEVPSLDCDDLAALLASLTLSVGGDAEFVTVAFKNMFYNGRRQYSHVFTRAKIPQTGRRVVLDPVAAENTNQMLRRVVHAKVWDVLAA